MSTHALDPLVHPDRWTEDDFFALPENRYVELLDGNLLVSPSSSHMHQWLSFQLCAVLNAAAPRGTLVFEAVNIRLAPDRIFIPDLAVIANPNLLSLVSPASAVRMVVEITSPGNAYIDRGMKPQLYAQAGIPHYLRVELTDGLPTVLVFGLHGDRYVETARFAPGEITMLTEPFPVAFDLAALAAGDG